LIFISVSFDQLTLQVSGDQYDLFNRAAICPAV